MSGSRWSLAVLKALLGAGVAVTAAPVQTARVQLQGNMTLPFAASTTHASITPRPVPAESHPTLGGTTAAPLGSIVSSAAATPPLWVTTPSGPSRSGTGVTSPNAPVGHSGTLLARSCYDRHCVFCPTSYYACSQCMNGYFVQSGKCSEVQPLPGGPGYQCTSNDECSSNFCAKRCCKTEVSFSCESCTTMGDCDPGGSGDGPMSAATIAATVVLSACAVCLWAALCLHDPKAAMMCCCALIDKGLR
eukprot:CAMPEP_0182939670 /NCGR_PEP_ID=MMETSP0105_2-20130417/45994_1 /TAXON_ID=81532 ORGANISM="Acanthoeca-like sp., Strain 10tr" /NCGR_SAMPLE_ID=MMETSP0105_2 /ASSEMBLY_ACC=CAM_ASM_000205 /LENGTH=246 /DNA_ID=CAMNT_0025079093 /DNA_START=93 /DNA_END=833 /DNA_ORIENTATION=+